MEGSTQHKLTQISKPYLLCNSVLTCMTADEVLVSTKYILFAIVVWKSLLLEHSSELLAELVDDTPWGKTIEHC